MTNAVVPHEPPEAPKEILPSVHEEPLDGNLSSYLVAVTATRPHPIRFNVNSGHIFHELVAHWPDVEGHEGDKRALCSRVTEIVYRLTAEMYAESVDVTIATAPPILRPPHALDTMATYVTLDVTKNVIRAGYIGPGHPLPDEMQAPIESGIGLLCQPTQSHHKMLADRRELALIGGGALPTSDPHDRNQDMLERGNRGIPEELPNAMPQFSSTYPAGPVTAKPPLASTIATAAAIGAAALVTAPAIAKAAENRPAGTFSGIDPHGAPDYRPLPYPDYRTGAEFENLRRPDYAALGPDLREVSGPNTKSYQDTKPYQAPDYRPLPWPDYHNEYAAEYNTQLLRPDYKSLGPDLREIAGENDASRVLPGNRQQQNIDAGPDLRGPPMPDYHSSASPEFDNVTRRSDNRTSGPDLRELAGVNDKSPVLPGNREKLNIDAGPDLRGQPIPDLHSAASPEFDTVTRRPDNRTSGPDQRELAGEAVSPRISEASSYRPLENVSGERLPAQANRVAQPANNEPLSAGSARPVEAANYRAPEVNNTETSRPDANRALENTEGSPRAPEQRTVESPQTQQVQEARREIVTPNETVETRNAPEQRPVEPAEQRRPETTQQRTQEAPQQRVTEAPQNREVPEARREPAATTEARERQRSPEPSPQRSEVSEQRQPEVRQEPAREVRTETAEPRQPEVQREQRPEVREQPPQETRQESQREARNEGPQQRPSNEQQTQQREGGARNEPQRESVQRRAEASEQRPQETREQRQDGQQEPQQQRMQETREQPRQEARDQQPRQQQDRRQATERRETSDNRPSTDRRVAEDRRADIRQPEPNREPGARQESRQPREEARNRPQDAQREQPQQQRETPQNRTRDSNREVPRQEPQQGTRNEPRNESRNDAPQQNARNEENRPEPRQEAHVENARQERWPEQDRRGDDNRRTTQEANRGPEQRQTPDRRAERQDQPAARDNRQTFEPRRDDAQNREPSHNDERTADRGQRDPAQHSNWQRVQDPSPRNDSRGQARPRQNDGARSLAEEFRQRDARYAREASQDPRSFPQKLGDAVNAGRRFFKFAPQTNIHDYKGLKETSNRLKMKDALAAKAGVARGMTSGTTPSAAAPAEKVAHTTATATAVGIKEATPTQAHNDLLSRLHRRFVHQETPTPMPGHGGDEEG